MIRRIAQSTKSGLAYIQAQQARSGIIKSFSSPLQQPFRQIITRQTTFVPSLVLGALHQIDSPQAQNIRHNLAGWLLTQKSPSWSFNYWARHSADARNLPYPDDLDDTFCALIGLRLHNPKLIDANVLARVAKLLIATESAVGGPYRTWLVKPDAPAIWHDVDVAVNSNIAYFLQLVAGPLPNLMQFLEQAIAKSQLSSPYYPSPFALWYYMARAIGELPQNKSPNSSKLAATLLAKQINKIQKTACHWQTPLQTALATSALLRLPHSQNLQPAIDFLIASQQADGSWPAESFCIDPARDGQTYYHGAAALTTALAMEALQSWSKRLAQPVLVTRNPSHSLDSATPEDPTSSEFHSQVTQDAKLKFAALPSPLNIQALEALESITSGDPRHEITMLPLWFADSLAKPPQSSRSLLRQLALANLFGWIAYTIYDDFLDAEGQPRLLPAANVAMRSSLLAFQEALPQNAEFSTMVHATFAAIDAANTWEATKCRFTVRDGILQASELPRYAQRAKLAERSIGHCLAPLGVLAAEGIGPKHPTARTTLNALKHYLVARQLNDDLHDWQTDLQAGQISYVVGEILRGANIRPGTHQLAAIMPQLQRQFWNRTLVTVCQTARKHTAKARKALQTSSLYRPQKGVFAMLDAIDSSISATLVKQSEAQEFLNAFRVNSS